MSDGLERVMFAPIRVVAADTGERDWCGDYMVNLTLYDAMIDGMKRHPILLMSHMRKICPIYRWPPPTDSSGTMA